MNLKTGDERIKSEKLYEADSPKCEFLKYNV